MWAKPKTYMEGGKFYGVVYLKSGHSYYIGPYNSRPTARRKAIAKQYQVKHEIETMQAANAWRQK